MRYFFSIIFTFIISIFCNPGYVYPQSDSVKIQLIPQQNLFQPTSASIFEAKNGILKFVNKNNLQLNIGISSDIVKLITKKANFSFGLDFFTFSNLRSEGNLKFPVDAIDYLFGINFNFSKPLSDYQIFSGRLRISHISAHLEDGHKYQRTDTIFTPLVYSREFLDLAAGFDNQIIKNLMMKNIVAINFLFHSIPDKFDNASLQYGIEFKYNISDCINLFVSNDLRFVKINSHNYFNENFETGLRFGMLNSKGIRFFFSYYDGQDYKGQYFDNYLNYKAIGINFDL